MKLENYYILSSSMTLYISAIKKQTSVCCSISLNPYMVFQTWNHGKKKLKGKQFYCLVYC